MFCSDGDALACTQPAALGNGPTATRRSAPPCLSCLCFLTLLLLLPVERSLLSPCSPCGCSGCAFGWMLAHSRGCWSRGSCFPLAGSAFPELLWMPPHSLPLPACSVGISCAWQKPLQMGESPSTPQRQGFAFLLLMFWDSPTSLCCYQEVPVALSPSARNSPAWSSISHKEHL